MKTKLLTQKELEQLRPHILQAWRQSSGRDAIIQTMRFVSHTDVCMEEALPPVCTTIRLWLNAYLEAATARWLAKAPATSRSWQSFRMPWIWIGLN